MSFDEPLLRQVFYQTLQPVHLPTAEIARRATVVSANGQFAAQVGARAMKPRTPFEPAQIAEQRMYEGLLSHTNENRMQAFRGAEWPEGAEITETFEDDRYQELARRLIFANTPEVLTDPHCAQLRV